MRILIAEDQRDLNKILTKKLAAEGYSVDSCFDGQEALDFLQMAAYEGVILDVMMPKMDGFTVVKHMRASGNPTPVLFLTARDSIDDKVKGLDLGANDYLVKPFSFEELMARVRALTRKTASSNSPVYEAADLRLDTASHSVTRSGKSIKLSAKEFALLEYMLRNKGQRGRGLNTAYERNDHTKKDYSLVLSYPSGNRRSYERPHLLHSQGGSR